ncbi:MAG: hypothetical protein AcusKO_02420 [Acuticoccus sp.]
MLRSVSHAIERNPDARYAGLTMSVAAITIARVVEALLYAGGFWLGDAVLSTGSFQQDGLMSCMDYFNFSLVNLTTLGRSGGTNTHHWPLARDASPLATVVLRGSSGGNDFSSVSARL